MLENFSFRTIVEYLPLFGQGLVTTVWLSRCPLPARSPSASCSAP